MNANVTARRDFIKLALAASSLPFIPSVGFASAFADDRTTWYRAAKFGMFIHWGPYSLASVEASWPIMRPTPSGITEAEYRELPKRFNPAKFDPYAFVDLARAAGQEYMVFTTKHHDGFCMFDSSTRTIKLQSPRMERISWRNCQQQPNRLTCPSGFTIRRPTCTIRLSVTLPNSQKTTGTVSPSGPSGPSTSTICNCNSRSC